MAMGNCEYHIADKSLGVWHCDQIYLSMAASTTLLLAAVIAASFTVSCAQQSTCSACNCQVNNIEALASLIDARIDARFNSTLTNLNSSLQGYNQTLATITGALAGQPGK